MLGKIYLLRLYIYITVLLSGWLVCVALIVSYIMHDGNKLKYAESSEQEIDI